MDKLTPGQLRDLAGLFFRNMTSPLTTHEMLFQEAARREGERVTVAVFEASDKEKPVTFRPVREGLGSAAPFRLEVGKEYARRDGAGPVKITSQPQPTVFVSSDGCSYLESGHFFTRHTPTDNDLVALWQAEAPQPVVSPDLLLRGIEPQADDLVHRLRFAKYNFEQEGDLAAAVSMKEAADRIDALKAQNKELDGQNFLLSVDVSTLKARVAKFEAEITRVRPKADCYDLVCATLGIEKNIIGHVEGINARVARLEDALSKSIRLSAAERQSKHTRVKWAEGLIRQLPITHEGAQSWLLNYGTGEHAADARAKRGLSWDHDTQSAALAGETNG